MNSPEALVECKVPPGATVDPEVDSILRIGESGFVVIFYSPNAGHWIRKGKQIRTKLERAARMPNGYALAGEWVGTTSGGQNGTSYLMYKGSEEISILEEWTPGDKASIAAVRALGADVLRTIRKV